MNTQKKEIHVVDNYFLNPTNPISVNLIGAGGTGSGMLTALARISHALNALDLPGLHVRVIDPDTISPANGGRLLFTTPEIGLPKSVALVNRVNRFFGTDWKADTGRYGEDTPYANLTVSCVDNVKARFSIAKKLKKKTYIGYYHRDIPKYWLDLGNNRDCGQVILSTIGEIDQPQSRKFLPVGTLPFITDEYGDLLIRSEGSDDTPSCSLAEALEKQDLFINTVLANLGASLLWQLFQTGMLENRGFFLNLPDFRTQPIKVKAVNNRSRRKRAA